LGHVAFRWRNIHSIARQRLIVALMLIALIPVGTTVSAYVALAIVAIILTGLVVFEAIKYRERRAAIRQSH
jgi:hypothetical protein